MNTPWGRSQTHVQVETGFGFVTTSSKAAIYVTGLAAKKLELSEACLRHGYLEFGKRWYEEDTYASIILWETPRHWPALLPWRYAAGETSSDVRPCLLYSLSRWHADYLLECGITPDPDAYAEYRATGARREFERRRARADPDLITCSRTDGDTTRVWTAAWGFAEVTTTSFEAARAKGVTLLSRCVVLNDTFDLSPCIEAAWASAA